ncbi:MAG TPA: DUF1553 domain-containing protein, partial [Thermomicrobiales bacterium]|nr:DUF1553 domain-containing protein [Thermomicrobiales bacterium]
WVAGGAADPRVGGAAGKKATTAVRAEDHWAYQPIRRVAPPPVQNADWPAGDIDRFILRRLEEKQLRPGADAEPAALVRRLYFDLIGLPPRVEEIEAFLADRRPDAYERLVERLLASPQYGERWGRHWLDVARYAESMTLRGLVFQEAWRYRDYVIDSFNADRPYDQFVREQVAGDLLPAESVEERRRNLIATSFLALGNANLEDQDKGQLRMDVVDEQLDTIGKGVLAQTIGCARCHDHKFDPIPTRDYYALAGILRNTRTLEHANVSNWIESPLPLLPDERQAVERYAAEVASLEGRIKAARGAPRGVAAAKTLPGIVVDDLQATAVGEWKLSQFTSFYIGDGYLHDRNAGKGEKTLTFLPKLPRAGVYEVRLAYTEGSNRATNVPVTVFSAGGEKTMRINERQPPPIEGRFVSLGEFRFELNGQGFVIVSNEATDGHVVADAVQFIASEAELASKPADGAAANATSPAAEAKQAEAELKRLEQELKRLKAASPEPKVMTVAEEKEIGDTQVHIRGNVHHLGERVARGFLQAANASPLPKGEGAAPAISDAESGRRQLADWLVRRDNPLTARVMANRIWHWLFGAGLVRTTDNFGSAGEAPSHLELLDFLAADFMAQNWSVKSLVRRIVLSRTYRLAAAADPQALAADPENRLLARAPRRRLDAECLRDAMLAIDGELELDAGGKTIRPGTAADYGYRHDLRRRSVYLPVFRNALPEIFKVFDFADTSVVTGARNRSTTSQQSLFFMNDPFVINAAQNAAARLLAVEGLNDAERARRAYRTALGRPPSESELRAALDFMASANGPGAENEDAWAQLWQAIFASLDFRFLD